MTIVVSTFLIVPVVRSAKGELKDEEEKLDFSFSSSSLLKSDPNSKSFVFPHLHGLIVVLFHILMNSDDNRHYKAPPSSTGSRGRAHDVKSRSLSSGA